MCAYCFIGDHQFRWDPPFPSPDPHVPLPLKRDEIRAPWTPWPVERLVEFNELLKRVKDLEDKLGCPCEPNKADYLRIIQERIDQMREMG